MYLGVDVGGTKTLLGVLDEHGKILEQIKLPTPKKYDHFVLELKHAYANLSKDYELKAGGIAIPGRIDRRHGRAIALGNLGWKNANVQYDLEKVFHCPLVIENDANLAALSEAQLHKDAETVLYVTVSTGIGTGVVYKQRLAESLLNIEGGHLRLPFRGEWMRWEDFASGRAFAEQLGRQAEDIPAGDPAWKEIVHNLSLGLFELIAITQPDLIIVGGSVGRYFDRYGKLLNAELKKLQLPVVPIPPVIEAERPELAVLYGCYDIAKQVYGHAKTTG
jgi:predicted NBD/HSP70 family sugar kinase